MPHVPALDGLRGVAVAGVVAFHLGYLRGGFLGVDLFFVLSGYLITSLLAMEWVRRGTVDLKVFWVRRARRLLPALFLVIAAVSVYAAFAARTIDLARIRSDGLATLLYSANWHELAVQTDYFDTVRTPSPLQHTWSLAIEEQFYVLWPLLFLAVIGRRLRTASTQSRLTRLFVVTVGLAVASATAMVVLHGAGDEPARVYYGTDTRVAAILLGAALALGFARWGRPSGIRAVALLDMAGVVAVGGLVMVWATATGGSSWLYEGGFLLCGLAVLIVIAAASTSPAPPRTPGAEGVAPEGASGAIAHAFSWPPLQLLGRLSYGLYLWHWPVITFLDPARTGIEGAPLAVVRAAVSLALALVSYELVEQPIRHGAWRGMRIRFATVGAATACTLALLAATTTHTTVLDDELATAAKHPEKLQIARDESPSPVGRAESAGLRFLAPPTSAPPAAGSSLGLQGKVLVVGDSGAYFLGSGMVRVAPEFGLSVVNRGTIGCGIARGDGRLRLPDGKILTDPEGCTQYLDRWRLYLAQLDPDTVILSLAGPGGGERFVDGRWTTDCQPDYDRWLRNETLTALRTLGRTGAQLVVTTIPYVGFEQPTSVDRRNDCRNAVLQAAARDMTGVKIVDLRRWACPTANTCRNHQDGVKLRPDGIHFAGPGADVASRWIFGQLSGR